MWYPLECASSSAARIRGGVRRANVRRSCDEADRGMAGAVASASGTCCCEGVAPRLLLCLRRTSAHDAPDVAGVGRHVRGRNREKEDVAEGTPVVCTDLQAIWRACATCQCGMECVKRAAWSTSTPPDREPPHRARNRLAPLQLSCLVSTYPTGPRHCFNAPFKRPTISPFLRLFFLFLSLKP